MEYMRQIGFGLSAKLLITVTVLCWAGYAAAAQIVSEYAPALQTIFAALDAKGVDMTFDGPIAAPLGIAPGRRTVKVHEVPPVRTNEVVHLFYQLTDASGYIVVRFIASDFVALRVDKNFDFVTGAIQRNGQPAAALSGAAVESVLTEEMRDCDAIASRLATHP